MFSQVFVLNSIIFLPLGLASANSLARTSANQDSFEAHVQRLQNSVSQNDPYLDVLRINLEKQSLYALIRDQMMADGFYLMADKVNDLLRTEFHANYFASVPPNCSDELFKAFKEHLRLIRSSFLQEEAANATVSPESGIMALYCHYEKLLYDRWCPSLYRVPDSTTIERYDESSVTSGVFSNEMSIILAQRPTELRILSKFGTLGTGPNCFDKPHGFCIGPNDSIVVADTNNHRISVFTIDGTLLYSFGGRGFANGEFELPRKVKPSFCNCLFQIFLFD